MSCGMTTKTAKSEMMQAHDALAAVLKIQDWGDAGMEGVPCY